MTRISIGSQPTSSPSPWHRFGLLENPFPASGVATDVDYFEHQPDAIKEIDVWLTNSVDPSAKRWSPLAISGSIGVGKTHVLRKMERACTEFRESNKLGDRIMVSSQNLPGSGMKNLLLSNFLMEALNQPLPSGNSLTNSVEMPLLVTSVEQLMRKTSSERDQILEKIPASSPIHKPLTRIASSRSAAQTTALTSSLAGWLARRNLSRRDLELLGLGGKLEGEGQAVRAFAHICLFAKYSMGFRVWFLLIDQMEDLWRRDVTTSLKRTRFLTDLRTLIDEALEGSPVSVTLAWNTDVYIGGARVSDDVEVRLRRDYLAMFSRVQNVVRISFLPRAHIGPFAQAYVEHGNARFLADKIASKGSASSEAFESALEKDLPKIYSSVASYGRGSDGSVVARAWLDALRQWADRLVGVQQATP